MPLEKSYLLNARYRILDNLGHGGMGSVYHALDESLGVEVAVKENSFGTPEYEKQFRLEAVILAGLRHPNLPRVTDHFSIENQGQYLVMDYIEGRDLRDLMDESPLAEEEAVRIGVAICDALAYLHGRRPAILHRDIKPGNVRIAPDGHVYLVDFGLAKLVTDDAYTVTGARALTPGYSPPEQYGTSHTDHRTDIYSLGATLYAALTGVMPEDGLARLVEELPLTPLRKRNPEVSEKTAAAIEKAMQPQTARRFQSAEEFKQALLGKEIVPATFPPPHTAPPDPAPAAKRTAADGQPRTKRKLSPGGCVLLLLLIVIGSGTAWALFRPTDVHGGVQAALALIVSPTRAPARATPRPIPATRSTTLLPVSSARDLQTETPTEASPSETPAPPDAPSETPAPTLTPTALGGGNDEIAYASKQTGSVPQIYLSDLDGSNSQPLTQNANGACQPSWAPDGKRLVFISPCLDQNPEYRQSSLYILDVPSGQITALPNNPGGAYEPAWSPDGSKIAFTSVVSGMPQIFVLNVDNLATVRLTTDSLETQASQAAWSPDSQQIVFTVRRFNLLQIWSMQADGTKPAQLIRNGGGFSDYLPAWSPDGSFILFSEISANDSSLPALIRFSFADRQVESIPAYLPVANVDFSPDGQWIAYETVENKTQAIRIDSLTGSSAGVLDDSASTEFDPAWRP